MDIFTQDKMKHSKTLKQWKTIVEKQTRKHDKKLRTNNGLKFVYEEFNN